MNSNSVDQTKLYCKPSFLLFFHSIMAGLISVLLGYIATFIVRPLRIPLPEICKSWNKNHLMEVSLFLVGFILFLILYFTGHITWNNKWYFQFCSKN
jgi:hypothetical protein